MHAIPPSPHFFPSSSYIPGHTCPCNLFATFETYKFVAPSPSLRLPWFTLPELYALNASYQFLHFANNCFNPSPVDVPSVPSLIIVKILVPGLSGLSSEPSCACIIPVCGRGFHLLRRYHARIGGGVLFMANFKIFMSTRPAMSLSTTSSLAPWASL